MKSSTVASIRSKRRAGGASKQRSERTRAEHILFGERLTTEVIHRRRSVRRYLDRPIPKATLARIFEASRWAPSAHNRQPWRFQLIDELEIKTRLADAMGKRLMADRSASGDPQEDIKSDVGRSRERITQAPVLILVCMTLEHMDRYQDERRAEAERLMAVQSTAMSVQNLLLAAQAEGLGSCWMCAPLFCPDTVVEVLGLPSRWQPQALITLGFPEVPGRERPRMPLSDIVLGWD